MQISIRSDRGFTLVEVMVAMVITLISLLGLLKTIEIATEYNLKNQTRDEAVLVAEKQLNSYRSRGFDLISTCSNAHSNAACSDTPQQYKRTLSVPSMLRGFNKSYDVTIATIVSADGTTVDLGVNVNWTYKQNSFSHEVHTVKVK